MNDFKKLIALREKADRKTGILSNIEGINNKDGERCLHILWLYPDILNLHGGRGDIMALLHVANLMEMPVEIMRFDDLTGEIPFEWADMICMNSGELKCVPEIIEHMSKQRTGLDGFIERRGFMWSVGSTGAVFAKELETVDGKVVKGLGLLDMVWKERRSVWGDDLWFSVENGLQVMGCQIQVADVFLNERQEPLGNIIYGRGNCGDGTEGARSGNVVYTNCLGPMMVKNPRFAESCLKDAAKAAGVNIGRCIEAEDVEVEDRSFELIKKFINNKKGI